MSRRRERYSPQRIVEVVQDVLTWGETTMARIYIPMSGGFGDVLLFYLHPHFDAGYVADIKRRYPGTYVRVILCSTNPHSKSFFAKHPQIDDVIWHPFVGNHQEVIASYSGSCELLRQAFDVNQLRYEQPLIYLDEAEAEAAERIRSSGPYVCLHPFAGGADRSWIGHLDVESVIDLVCNAGHTLVVLGGSSTRHEHGSVAHLNETLTYQRPGLVNIVNQHSVRLHSYLARHSRRFIGSLSAYYSVAAVHHIKSLVFVPGSLRPHFTLALPGIFGLSIENQTQIVYWDELGRTDLNSMTPRFLDEAIGDSDNR